MSSENLSPEQQARQKIDQRLNKSGWDIQDKDNINFNESKGVAIREYQTDSGPVDYISFVDKTPAAVIETKEVWIYDCRTNVHHTLKRKPMTYEHLKDFIKCYRPGERHKREETWSEDNEDGRWRKYSYEEIIIRDKTSLDITWIKDDSLTDLENLPDPDVLAGDIVENLEAGLESFRQIVDELEE